MRLFHLTALPLALVLHAGCASDDSRSQPQWEVRKSEESSLLVEACVDAKNQPDRAKMCMVMGTDIASPHLELRLPNGDAPAVRQGSLTIEGETSTWVPVNQMVFKRSDHGQIGIHIPAVSMDFRELQEPVVRAWWSQGGKKQSAVFVTQGRSEAASRLNELRLSEMQ